MPCNCARVNNSDSNLLLELDYSDPELLFYPFKMFMQLQTTPVVVPATTTQPTMLATTVTTVTTENITTVTEKIQSHLPQQTPERRIVDTKYKTWVFQDGIKKQRKTGPPRLTPIANIYQKKTTPFDNMVMKLTFS